MVVGLADQCCASVPVDPPYKKSKPRSVRTTWGYTLVELLVASVLTLILMTAVVQVFSGVGNSISGSRSALEQFDRLRAAEAQLRMDLQGVTATTQPSQRAEAAPGHFELIQGSAVGQPSPINALGQPDTTVGRLGDILMFTTRSSGQPFKGRYLGTGTIQSYVAEVAWFVRGRTLHRRVLLVAPGPTVQTAVASYPKANFFRDNDISARLQNGKIIPNTLADLTKREWRFAHPVDKWPFDAARWGLLGLPTLRECSSPTWMGGWTAGTTPSPPASPPTCQKADMWGENQSTDIAAQLPEAYFATDGTRVADDVVLNNVIGFSVNVWDYQAQQYVMLGGSGAGSFAASGMAPAAAATHVTPTGNYQLAAPTYDIWSQSYENEGTVFDGSGNHKSDSLAGRSTNGFDDDGDGIVDGISEWITAPPYLAPLRGIQVKIRCFEPTSRQVREVTVEQDFLPK
jgi:type II secretory pathway component PulJ